MFYVDLNGESLRIKVTYFVNGEVGSTLHPEIMSTLRKWLLSI